MTYILNTVSGHRFNLLEPNADAIELEDLALVLARTGRFGCHFRADVAWYSVAQHCVHVAEVIRSASDDPHLAMAGLLHDGHEAYWGFGDVTRPAKKMHVVCGTFLSEHARRVDTAINQRFGFDLDFHADIVRWADDVMLATESRDVMIRRVGDELPNPLPERIVPWGIERAAVEFRCMFYFLLNGLNHRRLHGRLSGTDSPTE